MGWRWCCLLASYDTTKGGGSVPGFRAIQLLRRAPEAAIHGAKARAENKKLIDATRTKIEAAAAAAGGECLAAAKATAAALHSLNLLAPSDPDPSHGFEEEEDLGPGAEPR